MGMRVLDNLQQHQSATPSKWREAAGERQANKGWLRYSQGIAMRMLDKMEQMHLTQKGLANLMGCSLQYVSKILKGRENLTLDTMYKIEEALHLEIMPKTVEMA